MLIKLYDYRANIYNSKEFVLAGNTIKKTFNNSKGTSTKTFYSFFFYSCCIIVIGVGGVVLNRTNIVVVLMSLELALLSVSLNFIIFSVCLGDLIGQIFAIFILIIAACESSIGLAISVLLYMLI